MKFEPNNQKSNKIEEGFRIMPGVEKIKSEMIKMNQKLKQKQNLVTLFKTRVDQEIRELSINQKDHGKKEWGLESFQKKIQNQSQVSTQYANDKSEDILCQQDIFNNASKVQWDYHKSKELIRATICDVNKYYPPSCSGYDITYCKLENAIYVYGGISCQTILEEGIKTFFYKHQKQKWSQVKPESMYCPIPRYGHTLTCYQRDLVLFGGVSEYKQKLKDRCFYSDISLYNTQKNQWRVLQTSGNFAKTRKNHATCMLGRNLFIYGGINENEEVIKDLSWINLEQRKPRWKNMVLEARFNHKMISVKMKGKQFLAIFGGRNENSEIISTLSMIPLTQVEGEVFLKDPIRIVHQMSAREMPLMQKFGQGFVIMGGNNEDNEVVSDCWYYQAEKQCLEKLQFSLDFKEMRGCQGVTINSDRIYILGCNSKKYKALQIQLER